MVTAADVGGQSAAGDADAAEDLFNGVYPQLAGWVRRLVDDDETAHEIASEAFIRLLARWTGLDSPQSYLYMIATNLVRDHWRKSGRGAPSGRDRGGPGRPGAYPAQDVDVRALIEQLPPGCAARSCCTTTPASACARSRPCSAARRGP